MKKLLLILLCLPMIFSCGDKEDNEIGRYDFEVIEMMDASFFEAIQEAGDISPSIVAGGLMEEGSIMHIIFRCDTKTGEIKYFDLLGNEIEKEEISKYKPVINPL